MSKKYRLIVGGLVISSVITFILIRYYTPIYRDSGADVKTMLIAHYKPGTCYGMPPGAAEPNVTLEKQLDGWHYIIEDGQCCEITRYVGVVKIEGRDKSIQETSTNKYIKPC